MTVIKLCKFDILATEWRTWVTGSKIYTVSHCKRCQRKKQLKNGCRHPSTSTFGLWLPENKYCYSKENLRLIHSRYLPRTGSLHNCHILQNVAVSGLHEIKNKQKDPEILQTIERIHRILKVPISTSSSASALNMYTLITSEPNPSSLATSSFVTSVLIFKGVLPIWSNFSPTSSTVKIGE